MRTLLLFTILVLCLSLCFTKTKKLASSQGNQKSHKAFSNAGKTTTTGATKTSAASTTTSTSTSTAANSAATTAAAETETTSNSTESSSDSSSDASSDASSNASTTVCNDSQKILNRQLNAYVTVEQGDNSSRVFGSLEKQGEWCVVNKTSNSTGKVYYYFEWNNQSNPVELEHVEVEENDWDVDVAVWSQNNTANFKWNVTEQNGYKSIRLYADAEYALAMNDYGELYISAVDETDPYQQWTIA